MMSIACMFPGGIGVGNLFDDIQGDLASLLTSFCFPFDDSFIQNFIFKYFNNNAKQSNSY